MSKRHPIVFALSIQALGMCALSAFAALSGLVLTGRMLSLVHSTCIWLLSPLLGLWLSMRCAQAGVPAILSWPLAPVSFVALYWVIVGMAPHMGAAALCALASIFGGAAGEVWLRRHRK